MMYPFAIAATLGALLLYLGTVMIVGRMRIKHKIEAPAVTGHPIFERAFRVQMNTLESLVFFLPSLWLFAVLVSDKGAGIAGLIWVVARVLYTESYLRDPAKRGPGASISGLTMIALFLAATVAFVKALIF